MFKKSKFTFMIIVNLFYELNFFNITKISIQIKLRLNY